MSTDINEHIIRRYVGELPLVRFIACKLNMRRILSYYIPSHKNETVPAVDSLMFLLFNITNSRQPLYELQEWLLKKDSRIFGFQNFEEDVFNDDRFGRALDKLY